MDPTPLRLAISTDRNYLLQTAVMLLSIKKTLGHSNIEIQLLHAGLTEADLEDLRQIFPAAHLNDYRVEESKVEARHKRLPPASFFRLLLPESCHPDWEYVLYLDVDMIVKSPLTELWESRQNASPVAMVRDFGAPHFGSPLGPPWRHLGVDPSMPYFNAGVMLCNLNIWREEQITERAWELLRRHELPHGDQCAINTIFAGRVSMLDPKWNVQTILYLDHNHLAIQEGAAGLDLLRTAPGIVHFNFGWTRRPWQSQSQHPERTQWESLRDEVLRIVPSMTPPVEQPGRHITAAATRSARHLLRRVLRSRG